LPGMGRSSWVILGKKRSRNGKDREEEKSVCAIGLDHKELTNFSRKGGSKGNGGVEEGRKGTNLRFKLEHTMERGPYAIGKKKGPSRRLGKTLSR